MVDGGVSPLVYRVVEMWILIAIKHTDRGPEPLFTEVSGQLCAVAFTDPEELRQDLPEGYRMYSIPLKHFLRDLPAVCGLIVDPRAASPIYIAPEERQAVMDACLPFPPGANIVVATRSRPQRKLLDAVLPRVQGVPEVRRLYYTYYVVEGGPKKHLLAYDVAGEPGADGPAADAIYEEIERINFPGLAQVMSIDDVPEEFRRMILGRVKPCYVRADLRG